jgi:hypothetical protein
VVQENDEEKNSEKKDGDPPKRQPPQHSLCSPLDFKPHGGTTVKCGGGGDTVEKEERTEHTVWEKEEELGKRQSEQRENRRVKER